MLRYFVFELSKLGIKANTIIISESHDASKSAKIEIKKEELRPLIKNNNGSLDGDKILKKLNNGFLVERYEGDFVFATNKGWNKLIELFNSLGVYAGLYYHEPFLNYKGNTILQDKNEQ